MLNVSLAWGLRHTVKILFRIEDEINESLDLLDKSYGNLTKISNTPVFYDDPQVKMALKELNRARDAVLLIANKLTNNMKQISESKDYEDRNY